MTSPIVQDGDVKLEDDLFVGPVREGRNPHGGHERSMHTNEMAQKMGFRSGVVAGSIHMDQFAPLLVKAYGTQWFERGNLSTYFRYATEDAEEVQAFMRRPAPEAFGKPVELWMDTAAEGTRVLDGTASLGPRTGKTALDLQREKYSGGGDVRILRKFHVGQETARSKAGYSLEANKKWQAVTSSPMVWYEDASPWGGPILGPFATVQLVLPGASALQPTIGESARIYGAIELDFLKGPLFADREYEMKSRILAQGETPKSEYQWYEAFLYEPKSEVALVRVVTMMRFMKQSAKVWNAA